MTGIRRLAAPLGAIVLVALAAALSGAAASLALTSGSLGAASAASPRCTTAGLSVLQNLSGTTVISVTIGNLPAGCAGATAQATVNNGVTNSSGSATVPAGGGSVTVVLALAVAVTAAEQTDLVMAGP